jgi:hypothetical protein
MRPLGRQISLGSMIREEIERQRSAPVEFRCCDPDGFREWATGGDEDTHYAGSDSQWQFCCEAYRPVCAELRRQGMCVRTEALWMDLLDHDRRIGEASYSSRVGVCSVEGCGEQRYAKGMCQRCYYRVYVRKKV